MTACAPSWCFEHGESVYERYIESDADDYWDVFGR